MMKYYVVKYAGPFGYIKPWTAVRDSETFSQQFLTPSTVEGMEKKLFPELLLDNGVKSILRHRLNYVSIDVQQERTWSKGGFLVSKNKNKFKTNVSILNRGVLVEPHLYLVFDDKSYAERAYSQHLCMCRNEDIMLPAEILALTTEEFDLIDGFELVVNPTTGFKVGHNRYHNSDEMFGELRVYGNPIRQEYV